MLVAWIKDDAVVIDLFLPAVALGLPPRLAELLGGGQSGGDGTPAPRPEVPVELEATARGQGYTTERLGGNRLQIDYGDGVVRVLGKYMVHMTDTGAFLVTIEWFREELISVAKEKAEGKGTLITLGQMKRMGWTKLHCGYVNTDTGKDSPPEDMTSAITRKHRDISEADIKKINKLLNQYQITTKKRICAFFAECSAESGNGSGFLEAAGSFDGPATRTNLNKWFDDNRSYGHKYRGAGAIQLTWEENYQRFSNFIAKDFAADEDIMKKGSEYVAFQYTWEAAVFFWAWKNLNSYADKMSDVYKYGDIHQITAVVNQGMTTKEYQERENAYKKWMESDAISM